MLIQNRLLLIILLFLFSCSEDNSLTTEKEASVALKNDGERKLIVVAHSSANQVPIVFEDGSGVSSDLVAELNKIQSKYLFKHDIVPTKRMKKLLPEGAVNLVAFSNPAWGWDENLIDVSKELLHDKDIYFTLKEKNKDQTYFDSFKNITVVGVKGFHYNFKKDNARLISVPNEKAAIEMILKKRGDIGVASYLNFQYLALKNPDLYSKLLFSEKYDSEYKRSFLLMKDGPISVEEINSYIKELRDNGAMEKIYSKYGLKSSVLTGK